MKKVFVSYKHDDNGYVNDVRSIRMNSNHSLEFNDVSLESAIINEHGDINRRSPNDVASIPVRNEIEQRLKSEIENRFDVAAITPDVEAKLAKKRIVLAAMHNNQTSWDYQPHFEASEMYVRTDKRKKYIRT